VVSGTNFNQGLQRESELFLQALTSPEGQARRHAFFAARRAQKLVRSPPPQHALLQTNVSPVKTAVIGAGTIIIIAIVLLRAGYAVTLVDVEATALARGVERIHQSLDKKQQQSKQQSQSSHLLERLSSTTELRELHDCQLIVEAVVENMRIKKRIFRTLDEITTRPDCLLLSNTSTLDIDAIASVVVKRAVAGWHFFSPAHVMPLVEIVRGRDTDDATVALLQALTKRVAKIGVVVGNCHGFCRKSMRHSVTTWVWPWVHSPWLIWPAMISRTIFDANRDGSARVMVVLLVRVPVGIPNWPMTW
jgi:hypothetical protein